MALPLHDTNLLYTGLEQLLGERGYREVERKPWYYNQRASQEDRDEIAALLRGWLSRAR